MPKQAAFIVRELSNPKGCDKLLRKPLDFIKIWVHTESSHIMPSSSSLGMVPWAFSWIPKQNNWFPVTLAFAESDQSSLSLLTQWPKIKGWQRDGGEVWQCLILETCCSARSVATSHCFAQWLTSSCSSLCYRICCTGGCCDNFSFRCKAFTWPYTLCAPDHGRWRHLGKWITHLVGQQHSRFVQLQW